MDSAEFKKVFEECSSANNLVLRGEIRADFQTELASFKQEIKDMVNTTLEATNLKMTNLESQLKEKDVEIADLKEDFKRMKSQTMALEFATRNKNLIMFKVAETENDESLLANGVSRMIREIADPSFKETDINDIYRMGKSSAAPRPIMLQLKCGSKRSFLLSQKRKFVEKKVGISEDLPKEVLEWRKKLYHLADNLRKSGKRVGFRRDKIMVDGIELDDKQIEEEELKLQRKRNRSESESPNVDLVPQRKEPKRPPKLNMAAAVGTPKSKSKTTLDVFFSPLPSSMNKTFEFVGQ